MMNKQTLQFVAAGMTLIAAALSPGTIFSSEEGRLIIEEGFESGVLPFKPSGNAPEVVQTTDARAGKYVMKSELSRTSNVSKRTEVSVSDKIVNFDVGKEYWVGISIRLGEDFRDTAVFNDQGMLLQWHYRDWLHPEVRDAQPLLLRFRDDEVHVHNEVLRTYMASVPPAYGEWVDWVLHVKFADKDGIIQVWRNRKQIVDWCGDNHQTEKHEGAYLKFGLYSAQYEQCPPKTDFKRTVYHDELRVAGAGGSYDLVAPRGRKLTDDKRSEQTPAGDVR
jgi:polysaccharide lyase-like protein